MKICIPTDTQDGLEAQVCAHFGRSPFFTVVDSETGAVTVFSGNNCSSGAHGHCLPVEALLERQVNVVACRSIGRGAVMRMQQSGIKALSTNAATVREVVERFTADELGAVDASHICEGGHHH